MDTLRNVSVAGLYEELLSRQSTKRDLVVPSNQMLVDTSGNLILSTGTVLEPSPVCEAQIAEKLGIPKRYYDRMKSDLPTLLAENANGWLQKYGEALYLVRSYAGDGGRGTARAFLSSRYRIIENIEILLGVLETIKTSGLNVEVIGGDLSDDLMTVNFRNPEIEIDVESLGRYRGGQNTKVNPGFFIRNSETGHGAFQFGGRAFVQVCQNGMRANRDIMRKIHLGENLEEGQINWSDETRKLNRELIVAQAKDAVGTFLDPQYWKTYFEKIEKKGAYKVERPAVAITNVTKSLGFAEYHAEAILNHFIDDGDRTSLGVLHAMTRYAQDVKSPELAEELEMKAEDVLDLVPKLDVQTV